MSVNGSLSVTSPVLAVVLLHHENERSTICFKISFTYRIDFNIAILH